MSEGDDPQSRADAAPLARIEDADDAVHRRGGPARDLTGRRALFAIEQHLEHLSTHHLYENPLFAALSDDIPGADKQQKLAFVRGCWEGFSPWAKEFVGRHGVKQAAIVAAAQSVLGLPGDKQELLVEAINQVSDSFEHTGILTVAERLIGRAIAEI